MHVKLKWGMHSLKNDHGVVPEPVWREIVKMGYDLDCTPEDVARAWLEGFAEVYELCGPVDPVDEDCEYRIDTIRFARFTMEAIERLRLSEFQRRTRSQIIEEILHEKFFLDDQEYANQWLHNQRRVFEAERMKMEKKRLSEMRDSAPRRVHEAQPKSPLGARANNSSYRP